MTDTTEATDATDSADATPTFAAGTDTGDGDDAAASGEDAAKADGDAEAKDGEFTDFTFPEGVTADAELMEGFTVLAKESGLTQEQAQKFIDLQTQGVQSAGKAQVEAWDRVIEDWNKETQEDPDIGGTKLAETSVLAEKTLKVLGTVALSKLLQSTGLNKNVEILRVFARIGRAIGEDMLDLGKSGAEVETDQAKIMFPTMN